ncbi:hypothetical protein TNCV_1764351 [Trichonephila clavipes]|nr:hypothetical protein TNCV_1764351 [Trichonephila clavipes]
MCSNDARIFLLYAYKYCSRETITRPGFHRSTNRRHATQQNGKHHFCHAQHHRLSRYGIEDCLQSRRPKLNAYSTPIQQLHEKAILVLPNGILFSFYTVLLDTFIAETIIFHILLRYTAKKNFTRF